MEKLAHELLSQYYDLSGSLERLNAYASENFLLTTKSEEKYVLKIYVDPGVPSLIGAENEILRLIHQANPQLDLPLPVKSRSGSFEELSEKDGRVIVIRILTFIDGTFLANTDRSPALFERLGRFLAQLDLVLLNCRNPVIECRRYEWDIQHLYIAEKHLSCIPDIADRNLVKYFFLQYRERVQSMATQLRHSIIHDDAHEWNILINQGEVDGIIDFGDVVYAPLVQEVAVAMTYAMMDQDNPLEIAKVLLKSYHASLPLREEEIKTIYYMICARLGVSVCMSAYSKKKSPENDYATISEKHAWALLKKLLRMNPSKVEQIFLDACGYKPKVRSQSDDMIRHRQKHISSALSLSYQAPIEMEGAAFQYMYGANGMSYLDCVNNIFHVGHAHPRVVNAAQRQMARLNTNTRYLYDQLNQYAGELLSKFDSPLEKIFFVNSGSAAVDLALRLARNYTGSKRTLVIDHGYHGNTEACIEVSPYKFNGKGGKGKADHIMIAPLVTSENEKVDALKSIREQMDVNGSVGSFIAESIVGCGGQVPLAPGYVQEIYGMMHSMGSVCIADEVQTGFGRIGTHFWAYQSLDVQPDIVVLGKPMGNGHPLAAVVTTKEITDAFENGMEFFSSFGGNPVSCAIGQAVLDVIHEEGLQQHAKTTGEYLINELKPVREHYETISDVRGTGLFLGIELTDHEGNPATTEARNLINDLKEDGILLSTDGPYNNVIKIKPPMCFDKGDADLLVDKLANWLESVK